MAVVYRAKSASIEDKFLKITAIKIENVIMREKENSQR